MDGVEIIAPPQYSVAWLILAALCLIVGIGLSVIALKLTRWLVERKVYARRPQAVDALKADFLLDIGALESDVESGRKDAREGHRTLEGILRMFIVRTEGLDVQKTALLDLVNDPRTRHVGLLIAQLHRPGYSRESHESFAESMNKAREVIRSWS